MTREQLYQTLRVLRERTDVGLDEVADAAVSATAILGVELVDRIVGARRDRDPHDARADLEATLVDASRVTARGLGPAELGAALRRPEAREALAITIEECVVGPTAIAALAELAPVRLRELAIVKSRVRGDQVAALLATPLVRRLERLSLRNNPIGDALADALARVELPALRALDLGYTRITPASAARLVDAAALRGLRGWASATDKLGPDLGRTLARGRALAKLTGLHLSAHKLGTAGLAALVDRPAFAPRTLVALDCGATDKAVEALAASPAVASLAELRLRGDPITSRGLAAIARSPHLGALRRLQIGYARVDRDGLLALADSARALVELDLGGNPDLGRDALEVIASSDNLGGLRHLVLDGTHADDAALRVLLARDALPRLETLSLHGCALTDAGLATLARWPRLPALRELAIGGNRVSPAGLAQLAPFARSLIALEHTATAITDADRARRLPGVARRAPMAPRWAPWPA